MDTIKIDKYFQGMVAHRGLSGIETENTINAFTAAANRSYVGIECDIHPTKDRKFVISHDDSLNRLGFLDLYIPSFKYDELLRFSLIDKKTGYLSNKVVLPLLEEYLDICLSYQKIGFIELKHTISLEDDVDRVIEVIKKKKMLNQVVIISFEAKYLERIRKQEKELPLMLLANRFTNNIFDFCEKNRIGIDLKFTELTDEIVKKYHMIGLKVCVFTVDNKDTAERLIKNGVDYITTNILE